MMSSDLTGALEQSKGKDKNKMLLSSGYSLSSSLQHQMQKIPYLSPKRCVVCLVQCFYHARACTMPGAIAIAIAMAIAVNSTYRVSFHHWKGRKRRVTPETTTK